MYASENFKKIDDITYLRILRLVVTIAIALVMLFTAFGSLTVHAEEINNEDNNSYYYYLYRRLLIHDSAEVLVKYSTVCDYRLACFVKDDHYYGPIKSLAYSENLYIESYDIIENPENLKISSSDFNSSFNGDFYSLTTNLPCFPSREEAAEYIKTGDASKALNKYSVDLTDTDRLDSEYNLLGFKCTSKNGSINASWTGATSPTRVPDNDDVTYDEYVKIYADYGSGREEVEVVSLSELSWSKTLSDLTKYDSIPQKLEFLPMYAVANGIFGNYYWGNMITVELDEIGNISKIDRPSSNLADVGVLNVELEIPRIVMINGADKYDGIGKDFYENNPPYLFEISNANEKLNIEIQGRWYSVDDIGVFKENLMWKYKYESVIKGELSTWIAYEDSVSSVGQKDLAVIGQSQWKDLLTKYPIDSRNVSNVNTSGVFGTPLFPSLGYDDALVTLNTLLLPNCESLLNGCEIYVRFWYSDAEGIHYSKWAHWFDDMASSDGSSGSQFDDSDSMFGESQSQNGLTDSEKDSLEDFGYSKSDNDVYHSIDKTSLDLQTEQLWNSVENVVDSLGDFPSLFARVFSFLPSWLVALVAVGIGAIVILRFVGR